MNWLNNEEQKQNQLNNDIENFHKNLTILRKVCNRVQTVLYTEIRTLLKESLNRGEYRCSIPQVQDDRCQIWDDLHIDRYERVLIITHTANSNLVELAVEKTLTIVHNSFNDNLRIWQQKRPAESSSLHKVKKCALQMRITPEQLNRDSQ